MMQVAPERAAGELREHGMAKGQKKSNKEVRKPKQVKPKPPPAGRTFLDPSGGKGR